MIKTAKELAAACLKVAKNFKTLYVMGCFGAPMNSRNKERYCNNHDYNRDSDRRAMIRAASADTFGFDCVCLIKGLLWGWEGDTGDIYGGAGYACNGVPDIGANQIIKVCADVSTDFSTIAVGELVWMDGHAGIYIGDGLAVECTPRWANCVQVTAVHNIGKKAGYNGRSWTKHGKLPYVSYDSTADTPVVEDAAPADPEKSVAEVAREVIQGKWGNGQERKDKLTAAGYDYDAVQDAVNYILRQDTPAPTKSIDELAREVIRGDWDNGAERKRRLTEAGYDYAAVQARVNELLG